MKLSIKAALVAVALFGVMVGALYFTPPVAEALHNTMKFYPKSKCAWGGRATASAIDYNRRDDEYVSVTIYYAKMFPWVDYKRPTTVRERRDEVILKVDAPLRYRPDYAKGATTGWDLTSGYMFCGWP